MINRIEFLFSEKDKFRWIPIFISRMITNIIFLMLINAQADVILSSPDKNHANIERFFIPIKIIVILFIVTDAIIIPTFLLSSKKKFFRKRDNSDLSLFRKNPYHIIRNISFITYLIEIPLVILIMGYTKKMLDVLLPVMIIVYSLIYIAFTIVFIKYKKEFSEKLKFCKERLIFLKASSVEYDNFSKNLFDENAVVIENLTDYMISSFSLGNFSSKKTIFYDMENELIPWLGKIPQFKKDMLLRKNHIIIADCKKIPDIQAFVKEKYNEYRHNSSKYSCISIGLVNAEKELSEKDFDTGLSNDLMVISFPSRYHLDLSGLSFGRISYIKEIGTKKENEEVIKICRELMDSGNAMLDENSDLYAENAQKAKQAIEMSEKYFNGITTPDFDYMGINLILDRIESKRIRNVFFSRIGCNYLSDPESKICDELRKMGIIPEINPDNEFLYSIFKNINSEASAVKKIMAAFDYIDFMLRMVSVYYHIKNGGDAENYQIETTFYNLSRKIISLADEDNTILRKTVDSFSGITSYTKEYFHLISVTGKIDFCGLCRFIDIVRNKTRGHGSVSEENAAIIHCFLIYSCEMLHDFLEIRNFNIIIENNICYAGYKNDMLNCNSIVYLSDGLPCIPIRVQNHKKEYVNFFKGKYIIPDFIRKD